MTGANVNGVAGAFAVRRALVMHVCVAGGAFEET
jgi:hypothetical protein